MNAKKILVIVVALVLCRATLHLFAPTDKEIASMGISSLQNNIIQGINQLLGRIKSKNVTSEEAQNELRQIQALVEAYAQRPDRNENTLASFNNSMNQIVPKFIVTSFPAAAAAEKDPAVQTLIKEMGATTLAGATANIKKIKAEAPDIIKNLSSKADAFTEQDKPVIDRDLEKLFAALDATTAKEARKNIEALEANIEKKIIGIATRIQTSYRSIAENANSQKLRDMISKYDVMDFIKPATQKALNDAIANMLYQARTDIFTMRRTLVELDAFFKNNPSLNPPSHKISGAEQKKEVEATSLD
jgi:hypothetical protein